MAEISPRVARISDLRASCTPEEVDRLAKMMNLAPRAIALALIQGGDGRALVDRGYDSRKKEVFYRPLGGGVAFCEPAASAVVRELKEETGLDVVVHERLAVFDNIFSFEGAAHHEIVFVFRTSFRDAADDGGPTATRGLWKNVADIAAEGATLYPAGLSALM